MHITELYQNIPVLDTVSHTYFSREGIQRTESEPVLHEHVMDVYVNEALTMKLICIPEHLSELVLGRLLTEGIIDSAEDVDSIHVCEYGKRARVFLKNTQKKQTSDNFVEETPSCCTGNHVFNDYFINMDKPEPVVFLDWKADWIFDLADRFAQGMPYHSQTFATHSCFLSMNGKLLFQCEDIGRHNALDKVIGFALRNEIDLRQCIVYSSGRIPTDMVMKAVRARIPLLASKASPTIEAAEFAKEFNLTLICAARRDRMKIF